MAIRTAVQVDDRMTPAFRSITNALNITISSFEALQRASSTSMDTSSIEAARRELSGAELAVTQLENELRDADEQQQQFNNSVRNGGTAMDGLVNKVKSLASAYLGVRAIQEGMEATDTYVNNQARLGLIVEEPSPNLSAQDAMNAKLAETAELQEKIYGAAQRSRGEYGTMVDNVAKLGLLAGDSFNNTDEIVAFTETMQKAFKVSGASTQEATNAMYQLNQAMASGRLQGDEYRSIIENAPMLANALADYCGVTRGELKDLSSEGALTADVIKGAVFNMADGLQDQFDQMPMTFSDAWTSIKNTATVQAQETMQNVNNTLNSNGGQSIINGITSSIGFLISALGVAFTIVAAISGFFTDNWSWISPIILGIAAAYGAYNAVLLANNTYQAISNGLKAIATIRDVAHGTAVTAEMAATAGMTQAQLALNGAIYACPITWIILAIIALIAIFYAAVAAVNHFAGTSYSATGAICGAFAVAGAVIGNTVIGLINMIIGWGVRLYNLIASFANFFGNVFNDPVTAIAHLFADLFDNICQIVQNAAAMIDALLGTDISGAVAGFRSDVQDFVDSKVGENQVEVLKKVDARDYQLDRLDYSNAYDAGYKFGQGVDSKVSDALDFSIGDYGSAVPDYSNLGSTLGDVAGNTGDTADSAAKAADALDTTEEDLKYLRDIAEKETINRFTTAEIKVDMGGVNNTVNNMQDLDGIGDYLADVLQEQMQVAAEGVHE